MRHRLIAVCSLVLGSVALVPAPGHADTLPSISIDSITVQEPAYPTISTVAVFTVSLDQRSDSDVTVTYSTNALETGYGFRKAVVPVQGTATIRAGRLSTTVPITVQDDSLGPDKAVNLYLNSPTNANLAAPTDIVYVYGNAAYRGPGEYGTATIINHDRLGNFGCAASAVLAQAVPSDGYLPSNGPRPQPWPSWNGGVASIGSGPCHPQAGTAAQETQVIPATDTTPAVTITTQQDSSSTDALTGRDPLDFRPTVGDFADAQTTVGSVTIDAGLAHVVITGMSAHVRGTCAGLGGGPTFSTDSTVTSVAVNGVTLPVVPVSLDLGAVKLKFNDEYAYAYPFDGWTWWMMPRIGESRTRAAVHVIVQPTAASYPSAIATVAQAGVYDTPGSPCSD